MAPLPERLKFLENETERLACLHSYDLLDSGAEEEFDELNHLAASICETPVSLIVLLDKDRQWFKSRYGWDKSETERAFSFCHYTLLEEEDIMEVENVLDDKRFAKNPFVLGDPHIRYYCGSPLVNPEGFRLGSLCVIDRKSRKLSSTQKEALVVLSRQIVTHFELHKNKLLLQKQKDVLEKEVELRTESLKEINDELKTFIYKASHDIRGPIATILGLADLAHQKAGDEEALFCLNQIRLTGLRLDETLTNLLRIMELKEDKIQLVTLNDQDIRKVVLEITESLPAKTVPDLDIEPGLSLTTDKDLFEIIIKNLLDNSFKYFDESTGERLIKIDIKEEKDHWVKITIQDNGEGIEESISSRVYDLFFRGNRKSRGSGLGLFIAKKAIEKLQGNISFRSIPNQGTTFTINLRKDFKT